MEGGSPGLKAFFGFGIDGVYPFGCGFEFLKVILEKVFLECLMELHGGYWVCGYSPCQPQGFTLTFFMVVQRNMKNKVLSVLTCPGILDVLFYMNNWSWRGNND